MVERERKEGELEKRKDARMVSSFEPNDRHGLILLYKRSRYDKADDIYLSVRTLDKIHPQSKESSIRTSAGLFRTTNLHASDPLLVWHLCSLSCPVMSRHRGNITQQQAPFHNLGLTVSSDRGGNPIKDIQTHACMPPTITHANEHNRI